MLRRTTPICAICAFWNTPTPLPSHCLSFLPHRIPPVHLKPKNSGKNSCLIPSHRWRYYSSSNSHPASNMQPHTTSINRFFSVNSYSGWRRAGFGASVVSPPFRHLTCRSRLFTPLFPSEIPSDENDCAGWWYVGMKHRDFGLLVVFVQFYFLIFNYRITSASAPPCLF